MVVSWVSKEWYNLTAVNATDPLQFTLSVKTLYFNPLGDLILLTIFMIAFNSFNYFNNNAKLNFMFSSFAIALFSIFFRFFGLVSDFTPFLCWGIFALSMAILTLTR